MNKMLSQMLWHRFTPFLGWFGELKSPAVLRADIIAGITVALVLIPQSMAYAQLAGLPPYYGLYAAFLPPIVAALFGSSRQLATGPVAVVSLLTAAALEPLATAGSGSYIAYAILLALMVGVFQLALGLLRMGVLVNFLSHPVVLGFTNAAAIIIATSQLGKIFGVDVEKSNHQYETVWNTIVAATTGTHLPTLLMAILAFSIMYGLKRFYPKAPGVLVAVAVTTTLAWAIGFEKNIAVPYEQFTGENVQEQFAEQLRLKADLEKFDKNITAKKARYEAVLKRYGDEHVRTLTALNEVEVVKMRRERRIKAAAADLKALKKQHFLYLAGKDETGKYYLAGYEPEDVKTDGRRWRIKRIDQSGTVTLEGGGRVVGVVPAGLPSLHKPAMSMDVIFQLISSAIAIALIGFMEAISIAKAMATRTRQRLDANQELVGQGLSNIVGSLFQSYPASGSFSRSAVNIGAGAITGFSSIVTGLVVVITLLWFTPLLYHLPQPTLAAVIMMAVIGLVNIRAMKHTWQTHRHDGITAIITFVLALALAPHLDKSIMVGVILSLGMFLYRRMQPRVAVLSRYEDGTLREAKEYGLKTCENIAVIRFDGSLYFANISYFEDMVMKRLAQQSDLKFIIIDAVGINEIDASGEEMLASLMNRLEKVGVTMIMVRIKHQVMEVLWRSGFVKHAGDNRLFRRMEQALDYAWAELGDNHEAECPLRVMTPLSKTA